MLYAQDPIKAMHFSNSNPVCHAFDSESKDGHDLIIGLNSGDGKDLLCTHLLSGFFVEGYLSDLLRVVLFM